MRITPRNLYTGNESLFLRHRLRPSIFSGPARIERGEGGGQWLANENRPVSLLPALSKICERVALNQFIEYAIRRNCLSGHQSGNKKRHSTETLNILMSDLALSLIHI